eukprot:gene2862-15982_t
MGNPPGRGHATNPPNLHELECAVNQYALEYGSNLVPSAAGALHDALNLWNCSSSPSRKSAIAASKRLPRPSFPSPHGGIPFASTFYVSTTGSDTAAGTSASTPFKTLERARRAALTAAKPVEILIAPGFYYLNNTLNLGADDSHVSYTASATDGSAGDAKVVVSGGIPLLNLDWKPSTENPKIFVADVSNVPGLQSNEEQAFWKRYQKEQQQQPPPPPQQQPTPAGWSSFPGHCMGSAACSKGHCGCASAPSQLTCGRCETNDCFTDAMAACKAAKGCNSFAYDGSQRYELFTLNNWSAVPNSAWNAYAMDAASPPTPPPPGPPNNCGGHHPNPPHPKPSPSPPSPPSPSPPHKWGSPPALWNTLHVKGVRQVRARYPNGNPQDNTGKCFSKTQHIGEGCNSYLSAQGGVSQLPASTMIYQLTNNLNRNNAPLSPTTGSGSWGSFKYQIYDPPAGHPVYNKPMPGWDWKNNSLFSFWHDPFSRPGGVQYGTDIAKNYSNAGTGVVQMFHSGLWGGWTYQIESQTIDQHGNGALTFSHGGYQEARGSGIKSNHYFVENIKEELDSSGEWFHDPLTHELFFWPNSTDAADDGTSADAAGTVGTLPSGVVAPVLSTVVHIEGAENVSFTGITFTETRATYLDQYEAPSGGDWTVHRGATVEVVDSTGVQITGCTFEQIGGNGILLSNAARDNQITNNEFVQCGDSAVVSIGSSVGVDDGYNASQKLGYGDDVSILKKHDLQTKNFLINGYNGVWTLDHDDGSQYFNDTGNFMVFGGCKNYLGNHKSCDHNVIVHPGIPARATGGRRCQTDDNKVFEEQYHDNNHCMTQTWNNTFYSPGANFSNAPCSSLKEWQAAGQDAGSTVNPMPSVSEIVAMGKTVLAAP